jgi:hypothetical protein
VPVLVRALHASVVVNPEPSPPGASLRNAPTVELLELALRQAGALVRAEVTLATAELRADAVAALLGAVGVITAVALFALAIALLAAAIMLILGANLVTTLFGTACVLAALGGVAIIAATRIVPKQGILRKSRERVAEEFREVGEHAA